MLRVLICKYNKECFDQWFSQDLLNCNFILICVSHFCDIVNRYDLQTLLFRGNTYRSAVHDRAILPCLNQPVLWAYQCIFKDLYICVIPLLVLLLHQHTALGAWHVLQWHLPHWLSILRQIRLVDEEKLLLVQRSVVCTRIKRELLRMCHLVVLRLWHFACEMLWECWVRLWGNRVWYILLVILLMAYCSLRKSYVTLSQVIKWSKCLVRIGCQIVLNLFFRLLTRRRFMSRGFLNRLALFRLLLVIIFFLLTFFTIYIFFLAFTSILILICMYITIVKLLSLLWLPINRWPWFGRLFRRRPMFFRRPAFHSIRMILLVGSDSLLALLLSGFYLWELRELAEGLGSLTLDLLFFLGDVVRLEHTQTLESDVELADDRYFLIVEFNLMDLHYFQQSYSRAAG